MTPESLSPIWADGVRELCNHLWQSTLFLGIVALLALLLRKNQARIRYWLWMAASAKFLIPFSLLVSLGSHLPWPSHAVAPKTTAYVAIEEMSQPFLEVTALNTPIAIPVAQPAASHVPIRILPPMLTAVWLMWLHRDDELLVCAVAANLQISAVGKAVNRGTRG